jgi:outer membrane lipoprotein-sorting protein
MSLRLSLVIILLVHSACAQVNDRELIKLLRAHQETLLSETHPEGLQTLTLTGTAQIFGQEPQAIKILKKFPNKLRTETLQNNGIEVLVGFDGVRGWGRLEDENKVHTVEQKTNKQIDWLHIEAQFDNHLLRVLKGDKTIQLKRLPSISLENSDLVLHPIQATEGTGIRFTYYLNATNYGINRKRVEIKGQPIMEIRYRHYRKVEGFLLAHFSELYEDDVLMSRESYDMIEVNKPLYDFLFRKSNY